MKVILGDPDNLTFYSISSRLILDCAGNQEVSKGQTNK